MKRQNLLTTTILCLALGLGAAACKKDGGGGGAAALSGGTASFEVFPKSTQVLFGISMKSLTSSALYKKFENQIKPAFDANPQLKKLNATCGIDPVSAFSSILVGADPDTEQFTVIISGMKRADLESCAEKMAKAEGEQLKMTQEGNLTKIENDGKTVYIGWLDDTTMVTGSEADKDKAWVEARLAKKDGLAKDAPLMKLVDSVDSKATLWVVGIPGAKIKGELPVPAEQGHMALTLDSGLKLKGAVTFADENTPKGLVDQVNQGMQMAKAMDPTAAKMADKIKIAASGKDLTVDMELNESELNELADKVQKEMGPMMQMMGGM